MILITMQLGQKFLFKHIVLYNYQYIPNYYSLNSYYIDEFSKTGA